MRICLLRFALKSTNRHSILPHRTPSKKFQLPSRSYETVTREHDFPPETADDGISSSQALVRKTNSGFGRRSRNLGRRGISSCSHTQDKKPNKSKCGELNTDNLKPAKGQRRHANAWMRILNRYLPHHLRSSEPDSEPSKTAKEALHTQVLTILKYARSPNNAGVDLLVHMGIEHKRWKAVLWLTDALLNNIATRVPNLQKFASPSNIEWGPGNISLDSLARAPIDLNRLTQSNATPANDWDKTSFDVGYGDNKSEQKNATMSQIWYSVGRLIIEAAELSEEDCSIAMGVAYQIIAQIHGAGLVPENVYSYCVSGHNVMTQRPPILHLLSSRILTTLSDAAWRSHQDEVIDQTLKLGVPLRDFVKDIPGGRFRLKVRPLGPEIWLEFVLWCCVDGGFPTAGSKIIDLLRQNTEKPWFAVNWTSFHGIESSSSLIDWGKVKTRHGGSVGLIEGYNRGRPFVEMEPRTISSEVVLSLVEAIINSVNVGIEHRGSGMMHVQKSIDNLVGFLEPHSLPGHYFDYLTVRLLQSGGFYVERQPETLLAWAEKMSHLRSLESKTAQAQDTVSFDFESVLRQTEVQAGALQQSLEAFVDRSDVRGALIVFNKIQELVDVSKLRSITSFLSSSSRNSAGFFSSKTSTANLDFIRSHGQLPFYKLAAFLNLTTDSKLFAIGQWLLYSDDVDEAIIPQRLYRLSSLTAALTKFAGASHDDVLLTKLVSERRRSRMRFSVNLLRSLVNANVAFFNFEEAERLLSESTGARGGGYSPSNIASICASILLLELRTAAVEEAPANIETKRLFQATQLLEGILEGYYDGNKGDFRGEQRVIFRQQVSCLLSIMSQIPATRLSDTAQYWQSKFGFSNAISLSTTNFNTLLAGIVETKGAEEGMRIWNLFCEDPRSTVQTDRIEMAGDFLMKRDVMGEDDDWDTEYFLPSGDDRAPMFGGHIPFVPFNVSESAPLAFESSEALTSDEVEVPGEKSPPSVSTADVGFDLPYVGGETRHISALFEECATDLAKEEPAELAQVPTHDPIVRPDLHTLRTIVRAALSERRALMVKGTKADMQDEVLEWATQFFRAFGTPPEMIEQEIQMRISGPVPSGGQSEDGNIQRPLSVIAAERKAYVRKQAQLRTNAKTEAGWVQRKFGGGATRAKRASKDVVSIPRKGHTGENSQKS